MTRRPKDPLAQSVKQRLMNRCRQSGEDFNVLLTRYAIERFLYRLTHTAHASRFTLKGAMLFAIWVNKPHRPTLDVDLMGTGEPSTDDLLRVFRAVCTAAVESDGVRFDAESVRVDAIREDNIYQGLRVRLTGYLGSARIPVQIDVGFGDIITPSPAMVTFGPLLDLPPPVMAAYPPETVIAEKLEAMVVLGLANSRMKDFFDIWLMAENFEFDGRILAEAIRRTFERRKTQLEPEPICLTDGFGREPSKQTQWKAFVRRSNLSDAPMEFAKIIARVRGFLHPLVSAVASGRAFDQRWSPGGAWLDSIT